VSAINVNESVGPGSDGVFLFSGTGGTSGATYYSYGYAFILSSLPDYTNFTALFDQYRILRVDFSLACFSTVSTSAAAGQGTGAMHYGITDHDDATNPTASDVGVQGMREYASFTERSLFDSRGEFHRHSFVPRVAVAAYAGAFTSYGNASMWIDSNSPAVQHYGRKGIIEIWSATPGVACNMLVRVQATVTLECRDVR